MVFRFHLFRRKVKHKRKQKKKEKNQDQDRFHSEIRIDVLALASLVKTRLKERTPTCEEAGQFPKKIPKQKKLLKNKILQWEPRRKKKSTECFSLLSKTYL